MPATTLAWTSTPGKTLLTGVSVFAVSLAFFLWLQYRDATDRGHREMPETSDEIVSESDTQPRGEFLSSNSNTKLERSNTNAPQSASGREPSPDTNNRRRPDGPVTGPDTAEAESEQTVYEEPLGDLAISGRVLTRSGTPVAGIEVTATATHLFEQGRRKAIPRGQRQRRVTTGYDGAYKFEDLAHGAWRWKDAKRSPDGRLSLHADLLLSPAPWRGAEGYAELAARDWGALVDRLRLEEVHPVRGAGPVRIGARLPDPPDDRDIVFIVDVSVSMVLRDYELDGQRIDRMNLLKALLDRFTQGLDNLRDT